MTEPLSSQNSRHSRQNNPIQKHCSKKYKPLELHLKKQVTCDRLQVKRKINDRDSRTGRFIKGNQLWKSRSTSGRRPLFSSPRKLQHACHQYFEWVESNPYKETMVRVSSGKVYRVMIPKKRPMTLTGMCLFIGMSLVTWLQYKKKSPDFTYICTRTEMVIRDQKFQGAVVGFFKPAIIARELGFKNKRGMM